MEDETKPKSERQEISGSRVHIDGEDLTNMDFTDCLIVYSGGLPPIIKNTGFQGCAWEFQGGAGHTLKMLSNIMKTGETGRQFVIENLLLGGDSPAAEGDGNG